MKGKFKYLYNSLLNQNTDKSCPCCSSKDYKVIDSKYIVTKLFECQNCGMFYRFPKDNQKQNYLFYQNDYKQDDNLTTTKIDQNEVETKLKTLLEQSNKDIHEIEVIVKKLITNKANIKLTDFGCSWGYMTKQFHEAGFDVQGYDVSKSRITHGKSIFDFFLTYDIDELKTDQDILFSSHVI